jgi:hypothetical protein
MEKISEDKIRHIRKKYVEYQGNKARIAREESVDIKTVGKYTQGIRNDSDHHTTALEQTNAESNLDFQRSHNQSSNNERLKPEQVDYIKPNSEIEELSVDEIYEYMFFNAFPLLGQDRWEIENAFPDAKVTDIGKIQLLISRGLAREVERKCPEREWMQVNCQRCGMPLVKFDMNVTNSMHILGKLKQLGLVHMTCPLNTS